MWFSVHLKFPTLMTLNSEIEWNMLFRFLHPNQFKLIHFHDRPERERVRWLCNMYENLAFVLVAAGALSIRIIGTNQLCDDTRNIWQCHNRRNYCQQTTGKSYKLPDTLTQLWKILLYIQIHKWHLFFFHQNFRFFFQLENLSLPHLCHTVCILHIRIHMYTQKDWNRQYRECHTSLVK